MFVHVSVRTSDMDSSLKFYTKFLGLQVENRKEIVQTNAEIVLLQDPSGKGAKLELTSYRNQKQFIQADFEYRLFDHLAFEVKDMQETLKAMREAGVNITDEPFRLSPTGNLLAFVEDPDGTLIELIERKEG